MFRVLKIHAPLHEDLFEYPEINASLKMARSDGSITKFFDKISKTHLLILDEFGLAHLEGHQEMDLMETIEDRYNKMATIIASQLPVASWYDIIEEEIIADSILDKLVHSLDRIKLKKGKFKEKTIIWSVKIVL